MALVIRRDRRITRIQASGVSLSLVWAQNGLCLLYPVTIAWVVLLHFLEVTLFLNLMSAATGLLWGYLMFSLVHRNFHIEGTWFLKTAFTRKWFRHVRRLHDIHHHKLTNEGRMPYNMGICFYWFDRLFGTYRPALGRFNSRGLEKSRELYAHLYK